jgi:peroxiredoxin
LKILNEQRHEPGIYSHKPGGMKIVTGHPAPDFSLYDSDKNKLTLSGIRGRPVVLLFFPLAFTSVCTKELCFVRDHILHYNNQHATILAVSVDSPQALKRFKEDQQFNFTLLSDFNKTVSAQYGCLYESFSNMDLKGVSKRAAFVIDKSGIIRYAEVLESAGDLPDFKKMDEILQQID